MRYLVYLLIFFIGQKTFADVGPPRPNYQLFKQQGKQGIKDDEGNILIPAEYEAIGWSRGAFHVIDNRVGFKDKDQWGIISLENQIVVKPQYTRLYPAKEDLLIAGIKGKLNQREFLGAIAVTGSVILPFSYASIEVTNFSAIVSRKEGRPYKYGIVDLKGKIVLPLLYKDISFLEADRFAVKDFENKIAIYNEKGIQLANFQFDSISSFSNNQAIVSKNHLRGLINTEGQLIMPIKSKGFRVMDAGIQCLTFNSWSLIDHDNNVVALYNYDEVLPYKKDSMVVEANGKQWLIDFDGKALTSIHYDEIRGEVNGCIPYKHEGGWGILKSGNGPLLQPKFDSVFVGDNMIYASEKLKAGLRWSLYDLFGVKKTAYKYQAIGNRTNELYPVKRQGYWGFIDHTGEEIISCVYDRVSAFKEGLAVVTFHGEFGIIDQRGSWVVLPQQAEVQIINSKYYLTSRTGLTSLRSFKEGTVYFTENPVDLMEDYLLEHLSGGGLWKIDFSGRILNDAFADDEYDEVRAPSEGFYAVKKNGKYGFIDTQNRLRIANRYDEVGPFKEGLCAINLLSHWGFINKREQIVVQPIYNSSSIFVNGLAIVENDTGFGLINTKGDKVSSFQYDGIERLKNGRYVVQKGNRFGLLDVEGRLLINAKYKELKDLNNGFAIIKLFGKYGLVDLDGVDIIPVIYDKLYYDSLNYNYLGLKKSSWEDVTLP